MCQYPTVPPPIPQYFPVADTDTGTDEANRSPLGFLTPASRRWPLHEPLAVACRVR